MYDHHECDTCGRESCHPECPRYDSQENLGPVVKPLIWRCQVGDCRNWARHKVELPMWIALHHCVSCTEKAQAIAFEADQAEKARLNARGAVREGCVDKKRFAIKAW